MKPDLDKKASVERFLENVSRLKENPNLTFGEADDFLINIDATLEELKDQPDLVKDLSILRSKLIERMDVRAKEIGKSDEWEDLKKSRTALHAMDKLDAAKSGQAFFDTYHSLPQDEQSALQDLEDKGMLDFKKIKRGKALAEALQQNASAPRVFWSLFRASPLDATKTLFRPFALPLAVIAGLLLIWAILVWIGK